MTAHQNLYRLYDRGRRYAARLTQLASAGARRGAAIRRLAARLRRPRPDVRAALAFAGAVDHILACAGPDARGVLLSRRSRLSRETVMQISRTHPDRIRYEVALVQSGGRPLAPPPPGTDPPYDTLHYGEVVSRFARAAGQLEYVARAAAGVVDALDAAAVAERLAEIRVAGRTVAARVGDRGVPEPATCEGTSTARGGRGAPTAAAARQALGAAAGLARKNARDIDRLAVEQPPTADQAANVRASIARLLAAADRLEAVRGGETVAAQPVTPGRSPGTYVVVYHLPTSLKGHAVGRLGAFDFPAGFYLYVGSAFGPGGVAARVGRHLDPATVKKWNVDHLKDRAAAVEVWWTHDPAKRECAWSAALAALPELTAPASGFGSNDCSTCPAHLYHSGSRPDFGAFAAAAARIDGHAPVFRTTAVTGRQ